jgi:hypothetical protein
LWLGTKQQGARLCALFLIAQGLCLTCCCSNGTTWALFALTQAQRVQTKLREELLTVDTDNPTMDQLNALPYLDMVVRESLRVHPPVGATSRMSMKDDILPLSKPVVDRKGKVHHTIRKVDLQSASNWFT